MQKNPDFYLLCVFYLLSPFCHADLDPAQAAVSQALSLCPTSDKPGSQLSCVNDAAATIHSTAVWNGRERAWRLGDREGDILNTGTCMLSRSWQHARVPTLTFAAISGSLSKGLAWYFIPLWCRVKTLSPGNKFKNVDLHLQKKCIHISVFR